MGPTLHNPNKVLMGSVLFSDAEVTVESGDPATFPAGTAVRCGNTGELSLASGALLGVSLGKSQVDEKKTAVARTGQKVPVLLTDEGAFASKKIGDITFTAKAKGVAGDSITITLADTLNDGTAEASIDGTDITVDIEATVTTAAAIKSAIEAEPEIAALITAVVDVGDNAVAQAAAAETALEDGADSFPYVIEGKAVEIDLATGKAVSDGQATGAVYVHSGAKIGILPEFAGEVNAALIDMVGGL